eukprot:jgi/Botrbrau1/9204/Bobra.0028s0003.1
MKEMKYSTIFAVILYVADIAYALDNGLALRPPMGWMSWERFRCNVDCQKNPYDCLSERLIMDMADKLADDGFADLGYTYVIIDDCWLAASRDSEGRLQPDPDRFPSGIENLSDYVHQRKLLFGIYGDIGTKTCGGYPGMEGHLELDAQTFAEWGVDYVKVDGCYALLESYDTSYPKLSRALNQTGRPIVYSCSWPAYLPDPVGTGYPVPYAALKENCNLWRNYIDIQDSWSSLADILEHWALASLHSPGFTAVAGPGSWNDPDMLIIGNKGLTESQCRVQMGMWAIFAAPLLMSNDLRDLPGFAAEILKNERVIAINQDAAGQQGELIRCKGACGKRQIWKRRLSGGRTALAFLNLEPTPLPELCVTWHDVGLSPSPAVEVSEAFSGKGQAGFEDGRLCRAVDGTSLVLLVLTEPAGLAATDGNGYRAGQFVGAERFLRGTHSSSIVAGPLWEPSIRAEEGQDTDSINEL